MFYYEFWEIFNNIFYRTPPESYFDDVVLKTYYVKQDTNKVEVSQK